MDFSNNKNEALKNATPVEDFEWLVLTNGTVKITYYDGEDEEIVIPAEVDGKRVTEIGKYAFADCTEITSITIPDTVTAIADGAFAIAVRLRQCTFPRA